MLADPGLVIVEPVEMDQQFHVALEGEQRVFGQWMKRSKKNAGPQKSLAHGIGSQGSRKAQRDFLFFPLSKRCPV